MAAACGGGADAVRARIEHLLAGLPDTQRTELAVALAVDPRAGDDQYVKRVEWLARTHHRDPRTVRRHIDRGLVRIAEAIAGNTVPAPVRAGPWSTQELRVAVALDRRGPEVFELRRVVADHEGVAELDLAVTLGAPRSPRDDVHVDVFYGGTLKPVYRESASRVGYALVLPRPLRRGELHEYAIRTRVAPEAMKPYLVCVPRYPVALFDLRVRFPAAVGRPRVRRLDAVFQRDVDDPATAGTRSPSTGRATRTRGSAIWRPGWRSACAGSSGASAPHTIAQSAATAMVSASQARRTVIAVTANRALMSEVDFRSAGMCARSPAADSTEGQVASAAMSSGRSAPSMPGAPGSRSATTGTPCSNAVRSSARAKSSGSWASASQSRPMAGMSAAAPRTTSVIAGRQRSPGGRARAA
ncbi:hypothetical protein ACFQV2_27940 [Actinokineospora soli]|uniref:Uncharacterized protein n=1 Tax=Actinokineospora soli TaxID=1048753 RepID=A0ABW2TUQ0_9PSEU